MPAFINQETPMSELHCPKCGCDYCYNDGELNI